MARYTKIVTKTVGEWLDLRKGRIGGSEVSAIIGINPFESKYELYLRKTEAIPAKEENDAMLLGHLLEDSVAQFLSHKTGYQIIKNTAGNLIYLSEDFDFAEASPDRLGYLPGAKKNAENKCIIEIKTTRKAIDEDEIPEHWICQVQWYMGITGIHKAVIAWLSFGSNFGYKEIAFDEEFFNILVEEARQFTEDMKNGVVPEAVTARDVAVRYPRSAEGKSVEVSEDVALACSKYNEIKAEIKAKEEELEPYEDAIKSSFRDAEAITYGGLIIASFKSAKDSAKFDAKTFKAENPELAAKYTQMVAGSRRLNVKA